MTDRKALIFDIQRNSFVDGPGIRTTVFFKGCNLRCAWCHNPEGKTPEPEMTVYESRCTHCGRCKEICPYATEVCKLCGKCTIYCPGGARVICGKEYTVNEIVKTIKKDMPFYETSGGGVTFSGGECMLQIDFLEEILKRCKEEGISTAVDTAGNLPYEYFERIIPYTDLFLYDVKCFDSNKHKFYTGVDNRLILENLKRLLSSEKSVWIRIPVIESVNDSEDEMLKIHNFLKDLPPCAKTELLPYHSMGENKYLALGKTAPHFTAPSEEKLNKLREIFNQGNRF